MRRTIRAHGMLPRGSRVVVALSGGADSVALLVALAEAATRLGIEVVAGHYNHRLRGPEADADETFVRCLCARLRVPLAVERAAGVLAGAGIEAAARRERYAFLRRAAAALDAQYIATAHTLDDQAETVLMRLLRGSGAAGLSAIRPRRGCVIRPLMHCSRVSVLDYLEARGCEFRVDATNADRRFLRNRVRHDVLPVLDAINPRVRAALARTAATLQAESAYLERRARRAVAALQLEGDLCAAGLERWAEPMRQRIVRAWLRTHRVRGLRHEHIVAVVRLARAAERARASLPDGRTAVRREGKIVLIRTSVVDGV